MRGPRLRSPYGRPKAETWQYGPSAAHRTYNGRRVLISTGGSLRAVLSGLGLVRVEETMQELLAENQWVLVVLTVWAIPWKGVALWKSSQTQR